MDGSIWAAKMSKKEWPALRHLDLSRSPDLGVWDLDDDDDDKYVLGTWLTNAPALRHLDVSMTIGDFQNLEPGILFRAMVRGRGLETLRMADLRIDDACFMELCDNLDVIDDESSILPNLQTMDLSRNPLSSSAMHGLSELSPSTLPALSVLVFRNLQFHDLGLLDLSCAELPKLEVLDLYPLSVFGPGAALILMKQLARHVYAHGGTRTAAEIAENICRQAFEVFQFSCESFPETAILEVISDFSPGGEPRTVRCSIPSVSASDVTLTNTCTGFDAIRVTF